jgi:hypothetical protein
LVERSVWHVSDEPKQVRELLLKDSGGKSSASGFRNDMAQLALSPQ